MVGALHGAVDRPAHAQIGLHRLDLADIAERLQMAGEFGPAGGDPDPVAALGQRPHHMPADKAGARRTRSTSFGVCRISVMAGSGTLTGRLAEALS